MPKVNFSDAVIHEVKTTLEINNYEVEYVKSVNNLAFSDGGSPKHAILGIKDGDFKVYVHGTPFSSEQLREMISESQSLLALLRTLENITK